MHSDLVETAFATPTLSGQPARQIDDAAAGESVGGGSAGPWHPSGLRAVILLGGTVRAGGFSSTIERSLLDLPVGHGETLLSYWVTQVAQLGRRLGLPTITVRVVIGRNCSAPRVAAAAQGVEINVERDPVEFRGTGGVLRDLAREYNDEDLLLVANANLLSGEALSRRVDRLLAGNGDVRLLAGASGEPAGLFMLKCGCLRGIASSGFVDLKEQALPGIAQRHSVRVISSTEVTGHSIRRWGDYLAAVRLRHRTPGEAVGSPFAEDWQSLFSVVEDGAHVDPTAGVHDSVVLAGGRVEAKATLVRSMVAPGGVVRKGELVVGKLVTASGKSE